MMENAVLNEENAVLITEDDEKKTVLVVEDDELAMKLIKPILATRVKMLHAPSIEEAVDLFITHDIDAVLMDGQVPSHGTEIRDTPALVRWMKEEQNFLGLIIAMATAKDRVQELINAGCKEAADTKGDAAWRVLRHFGIIK